MSFTPSRKTVEWREYAEANDLVAGRWLARAHTHGMTPWELHALYLRQDGRCYLCDDPLHPDLAAADVDHDHACCPASRSCGRCVRGIACSDCNRLIGFGHDNPARIRRAADNLEAAMRRLANDKLREAAVTGEEARRLIAAASEALRG